MPPCRSTSGYHDVRARLSGTFYAEIRSGDERIRLGMFEMAHVAARAYDAVAWRLGRSRRTMNFHDVWTREQAEALAPPPPAATREQQQRRHELEQWLVIAECDERPLRLEWARQFPEDVAAMESFYEKKEEDKATAKAAKKADHEERRAKSAVSNKESEEKAARKGEDKKSGADPSTIVLSSSSSSSSSFEWTSNSVSSTTRWSDFDWDSE
nr:uncharacterized protein LOC127315308 [Lolium perenne]